MYAMNGSGGVMINSNSQIRGLEERLRAREDQLNVRDERLKLADDRYKELAEKLTVVTQESLSLQNQVNQVKLYAKDSAFVTIQSSVGRTVQAIESANTSSAALGRTLTFGPTLSRPLAETEPPKPSTTRKSE
jgi:hypothetical protein